MFNKWMTSLIIIILSLSITGCQSSSLEKTTPNQAVRVTVSFNAMKAFVEAVGKDHVSVTTIVPDGTEPHDFELKAQDLTALNDADLFVYSGLGMEAWANEAVEAADHSDLVALEAASGFDAINNSDPEEIEEHGQYDPHVWLSIKGAIYEIENIKEALINLDPQNKDDYEQNATEITDELNTLYTTYQTQFEAVQKKSFVTGHAAFGYLCRDFGLEQNSVEDVFAEGEPTAMQLTELVEYCKANDVTTIFAEEMASPEVSQTLANEVGATVETIYTMESNEDNLTYIERMQSNLEKIYASLAH